ncbi:MAG: hypothetical protein JWM57_3147 [Phycisphaerales bacterium]|nr:hypothetical protein [Phycisphaerales bacterium]
MCKLAVTQIFVKAFDSTIEEVCRHLSDHSVDEQVQWSGFVEALNQIRDAAVAVDAEDITEARLAER